MTTLHIYEDNTGVISVYKDNVLAFETIRGEDLIYIGAWTTMSREKAKEMKTLIEKNK